MQLMRFELVLGCAALVSGVGAGTSTTAGQGAALQAMSSPNEPQPASHRVVLVELFTSEGCSSCPPADDLLRKIDGKRTSDGALIAGISEHVNYWDHDGWKDPFDSAAITNRQHQYGERFHLESVYTPQMVVDGKEQFVGSDGHTLAKALRDVKQQATTVRIVSAKLEGNDVVAVVSLAGELQHSVDLFAVIAQDETTARVTAGENKGRTLAHAAVARAYEKAATIRSAGETSVRLSLPDDLKTTLESRRHLIVWAQAPDAGPVVGADTMAF